MIWLNLTFCMVLVLFLCTTRAVAKLCHTTFVNFVCNGFHPTWKFFVVSNKPIANCLLISVINLETIKFHILIYYAVQISVNNLFGNIVVVIIPSCVAIAFFCFSTSFTSNTPLAKAWGYQSQATTIFGNSQEKQAFFMVGHMDMCAMTTM